MSNSIEEYIEEYKKLEEAVRRVHGLKNNDSVVSVLKKRFPHDSSIIQSCADLRNFYSHDGKMNNRFIADVSTDAVTYVRDLTVAVNNRQKCGERCIKFKDIFWKSLNDNVRDTMTIMQKKLYTHVPILDGRKVIGVFDENSLFSFLAAQEDGICIFDDKLSFADLKEHIKLDNREMEEFSFFPINKFTDEAAEEFNNAQQRGKRIGLMLLTASGKPTDDLQGIITPWDIIG